jgi:hypothetical protein
MKRPRLVHELSHRILKRMERFTSESIPNGTSLAHDDPLGPRIGQYVGEQGRVVSVHEGGLRFERDSGSTQVRWQEIVAIAWADKTRPALRLFVQGSQQILFVPVIGADVAEFSRFLLRMNPDIKFIHAG